MRSSRAKSWDAFLLNLAYLSPFVFPLYFFRFQLYGIPFTVLEVFSYFFFAVLLLAFIKGYRKVEWGKPARWYYYMAFLLLIGATLGVLVAPHFIALPSGTLMDAQRTALGVWKGWVLAPLLYFFTLTQVVDSSEKVKRLLLLFVYSVALVGLLSYGFGLFDEGFTYDLRLSGFFESANYLSLYLGPALLLGVYFLITSHTLSRREELLNLSAVTVMTHALFLTQSYAAIIGVFGAMGLYVAALLLKKNGSFFKVFMSLVLLLFTFLLIVVSFSQTSKFRQFMDFENRSSSTVRLEIYEISLGLVSDYPLTGVGPGLFQGYYQTKGPSILGQAPMEWNIPHPHNIFLAFWLNAGLLGLLALLGLILLAHKQLTYPLMAFWGILIHGLFDTPFWKNDLSMIFWLILGAILILQHYGTDSAQKRKAPVRRKTAVRRHSGTTAKRGRAKK